MSGPIKIKTQVIAQDTFPGAYIEPEWSRVSLIQQAPSYAMRLVLGAKVVEAPRGRSDYICLVFEGIEYVIHISNYKYVCELARNYIATELEAKGECTSLSPELAQKFRFEPNFVINGMEYCTQLAIQLYDIPIEKTKMLWVVPDLSACGYYRSRQPFLYQQTKEVFFTESTEFANYNTMSWFDAFVIHRVPLDYVLAIFQNLKAAGKVILYEFDDDLFNIPDWNHNQVRHDAVALERARVAIKMADLIICSTEALREVSNRPEIAMVGPNLIDLNDVGQPLKCERVLDERIAGYKVDIKHSRNRENPSLKFVHPHKPTVHRWDGNVEPVRILWTGSNTHDQDLEEVVDAVISTGNKFGIGVLFIFFGYCPHQFIEAVTMAGNTKPKFIVKEEYQHLVYYVEPTPYSKYMATIRDINPDFAICPLSDVPFNMSKSPLKILELGALGIPCIATNYGPYELIRDHEDGLLVSVGDKAGWKYAIEKLVVGIELRLNLAKVIRERVVREYSWQNDSKQRAQWDGIFARVHDIAQERRAAFNEQLARLQVEDVES